MCGDQPSPDDPQPEFPACLVVHGLGGGPYELEPLVAALRGRGGPVAIPLLPGHEGPGPVMPASRWEEWAAATESAFDALAGTGRPVAVVGFSTGATLALRLASRRAVDRLVVLAPFLAIRYTGWMPFRPASVLGRLARLVPNLPRRSPAVRDPEMRRQATRGERFRTFNLNAAISALELIDQVRPLVPSITVPTLIIQGRLDTVVEPVKASWLYDQIGSKDKALIRLSHSDHLLALDVERERVIELALGFLSGQRCGAAGN